MSGSREVVPGSKSQKVGAGAAGAGSGTLLVLLANNLPQGSPWKSWLVIIAPSISIAVSVIYGWIRTTLDKRAARKELGLVVSRARLTLQKAIENPATSEAHRQQLRKELEGLELILVKADLDKIRLLAKSS